MAKEIEFKDVYIAELKSQIATLDREITTIKQNLESLIMVYNSIKITKLVPSEFSIKDLETAIRTFKGELKAKNISLDKCKTELKKLSG